VPSPEEKSKKHGFDYADNTIVVEEKAPWGGMVKYHHRSEEYQRKILRKNGFSVDTIVWGYEDFVDEKRLKIGEQETGRNLHGYKRMMFFARKIK
jgi:hypothetical protein